MSNRLIMQFCFARQTFHKSYQSRNFMQTLAQRLQSRNIHE